MVSPVILTAHNDVLDETLDEDWDLSTPSSAYSDQVPFWDDGREDEATEEDETPGATASYSKGPASVIARADKFFTSIFTDYCSQAALCIDMDQSPTETSDEEAIDTASRFTCKGSECTGTVHFAGAEAHMTHTACVQHNPTSTEHAPASIGSSRVSQNEGGKKGPSSACMDVPICGAAIIKTNDKDMTVCKQPASRKHWTAEEEERFLKALHNFGPKEMGSDPATGRMSVRLGPGVAEMISMVVGTRSVAQVRSHVQKYYIRKEREASRRYPI
jgi:hypothetical protein